MVNDRRFPAPWRADKIPGGYVVRDALRRTRLTRTLTPLYPEGVQRDEALNPGTFSPFAGLWDCGET